MTVVALDADRRRAVGLAAQLGAGWVDPGSVAERAVARASTRTSRDPLLDAVREEVSADLVALGTEEAYRRIVDLWAGPVLLWCRFGRVRREDPEEVAQEVLSRALTDLRGLRDPYAVGAWFWRTTWNVTREHERGVWRRWVDDLREWAGLADPTPSVPEQLAARDGLAEVMVALDALPSGTRKLLWRAYVDGVSRADLAQEFHLPVGTLNRRLTDARDAFRRAWAKREQR